MQRIEEQVDISKSDMHLLFAYWMRERTRALDFRLGFCELVHTYAETRLNLNRWEGCLSLLGLRLRHCDEKLVLVRQAQDSLRVKSEHLRLLMAVNPFRQ